MSSLSYFDREIIYKLIKEDLLKIVEDRKEKLLIIFREEMQRLDDRVPEENSFVDIKMVPLGEEIMRAALDTITRFIRET